MTFELTVDTPSLAGARRGDCLVGAIVMPH